VFCVRRRVQHKPHLSDSIAALDDIAVMILTQGVGQLCPGDMVRHRAGLAGFRTFRLALRRVASEPVAGPAARKGPADPERERHAASARLRRIARPGLAQGPEFRLLRLVTCYAVAGIGHGPGFCDGVMNRMSRVQDMPRGPGTMNGPPLSGTVLGMALC